MINKGRIEPICSFKREDFVLKNGKILHETDLNLIITFRISLTSLHWFVVRSKLYRELYVNGNTKNFTR